MGINGRFNVPADRTDDFDFITPKLGLVYELSDGSTSTPIMRAAAAPRRRAICTACNRARARQRQRWKLWIVLSWACRGASFGGDLVFDLAAYTADKDNFFFRDSDGLNVTDGSTRHQGIEFAANWILSDQFTLGGNLSWSDQTYTFDRIGEGGNEIIRDGNQIDTAPEWLANVA